MTQQFLSLRVVGEVGLHSHWQVIALCGLHFFCSLHNSMRQLWGKSWTDGVKYKASCFIIRDKCRREAVAGQDPKLFRVIHSRSSSWSLYTCQKERATVWIGIILTLITQNTLFKNNLIMWSRWLHMLSFTNLIRQSSFFFRRPLKRLNNRMKTFTSYL